MAATFALHGWWRSS
ncbi:trp operon leader peptide [Salmonella enterica]|nr:trp operon leader peptide [Salmonella enterica]EDN3929890.1 trp operon leader peptide [Salmonella enterica subsp. enterica serovar Infantis]EDN3960819.1 trp operon leader peptide [Salmonella enterica subsp. enterica serovar Infantis]EJA3789581.1 trp operon leader peptide [Salmonella enterica]EJA3844102.1 trp operon leader peptide [Salmonella enterica]